MNAIEKAQYLKSQGFTWDPHTNFSASKLNNIDFMLYVIGDGIVTRKELAGAFTVFRGHDGPLDTLLSREYNYISKSFENTASDIQAPFHSFGTNRCTLIYKLTRGVYVLNRNGMARLGRVCGRGL